MALFKVKSLKKYKFIISIFEWIVIFIFILIGLVFIKLVYDGVEAKDQASFCYGLFAANAIICNVLFGLGRSPVYLERFNSAEQKLVYLASLRFLYAAILTFVMSGWIYVNKDQSFFGEAWLQSSEFGKIILNWSLAVGITISIGFSVSGIILFYKWTQIAMDKFNSENE